eukprot:361889-Chlamydomonas_euryale.AAC.2
MHNASKANPRGSVVRLVRADPLPGSDPSRFAGLDGEYGFCDSGGYMEALMATINVTWPHPGKHDH